MVLSGVISTYLLFDPQQLPKKEDYWPMHGLEKLKVLTDFYGSPQSITFESKTALSTPDINQLIEAVEVILTGNVYQVQE